METKSFFPEMTIEEVVLQKAKRVILQYFSKNLLVDISEDFFTETYIIRVIEEQLVRKAGERVIKYPKDWKEAFREKWFPRWLKKKFPIKYQEYDALVMFPDVLSEHPIPAVIRGRNYYFTYAKPNSILPKE